VTTKIIYNLIRREVQQINRQEYTHIDISTHVEGSCSDIPQTDIQQGINLGT
jgi:hypothetical protein